MAAAPNAADPSRMLSRFLSSCFKRKRRKQCVPSVSKEAASHTEGSDETDRDGSSDPGISAGAAAPTAAAASSTPAASSAAAAPQPRPAQLPIRNNKTTSNNSCLNHHTSTTSNHSTDHNHPKSHLPQPQLQPPPSSSSTSQDRDSIMPPRISKKAKPKAKANLKAQAARSDPTIQCVFLLFRLAAFLCFFPWLVLFCNSCRLSCPLDH